MSGQPIAGSSGSFADSGGLSRVQRVARQVSRISFLAAAVCILLMLVVVYRLWALATAQQPEGIPFGWAFDFGGALTAPFRDGGAAPQSEGAGYLDFAGVLTLDVLLIATFGFAILGYLSSLLLPGKPEKAQPVQMKEPPKPHVVPAIRATTRWTGRSIAALVTGMAGLALRFADLVWTGLLAVLLWAGLQVVRLAAWYRAGCERDAVELRAFWDRTWANSAPRLRRLDAAMRQDLAADRAALGMKAAEGRVTAVRLAAAGAFQARLTWQAFRELTWITRRDVADYVRGLPAAVREQSHCYWSSLGEASRSVMMLPAVLTSAIRERRAAPTEEPEPAKPHSESRRAFLRRVAPLPPTQDERRAA
jgi:hypothetical protein